MRLNSIRIITADVPRLVTFYEQLTEGTAAWASPLFAEIRTPGAVLAIGSDRTVSLFAEGSAEPAANRSAIVEYLVDDVDAEYRRLKDLETEVVTEPTDMPWGNRALLLRDPDGNLINLFTPVTDDARYRSRPVPEA
ncbi:VOC family protein [Microlunatus soli]|uniref:Uncharacterized conserved protein PhnB, glyoxalase superfamily n=1 Tax=Microlunatus soli TaxID=630515 RepID=A0A1H1YC56_9ACTN|nr:VOC family protein [Microlunatus soli]SDT18955.1 Uncharacterized conserved protein PhnB, glyoxalase superfamily [Microlunatus soli]